MEAHSGLKRKGILSDATTRTDVKSVMLSEEARRRRQALYDFTYMRQKIN